MNRAVVIGSGMAGLTAAVLLGMHGIRTTVLEQHTRAGGLLQRFWRGKAAFDIGFHYCGGIDEQDVLGRALRHLGVFDRLQWLRMDPEGFDRLRFPGFEFRVPVGLDRYRERLKDAFPLEAAGIDGYLADLQAAVDHYDLYQFRTQADVDDFLTWEEITLAEVLDRHVHDPRLRAVLSGEVARYMVPPREAPFGLHAIILHHFLSGAWRIAGGGGALARALIHRVRETGGEIHTDAEVAQVLVDGSEVRGVETAGGERFDADFVVSSLHPRSLLDLLPDHAVRPAYRSRVRAQRVGWAHLGVYLTLDTAPLCIGNANVYRLDRFDPDRAFDPPGPDCVPYYFATAPCPDLSPSGQGPPTVMLSLPHTWEDVADWADSRPGARPAAYLAWKRSLQDAAVRAFLADFPELVGHVVHVESSTGLSTLWHTRSPRGAEFGHYHSVSQMGRNRPAQFLRLKGLVQVGQGAFIPGILGATLSSYYGVGRYLGFDRLVSEMEAT